MKIYRVERNGWGPYRRSWEFCGELHDAHKGDKYPNPRMEGLCEAMRGDFCGFATVEQLKQWFKGWRTKLRKNDFRMKVYEISHKFVKIGEKQLIFKKVRAMEVACLNIP